MPVSFILKRSVVPPPDPKVYSTPLIDEFDGDNGDLANCEHWTSYSNLFDPQCRIYENSLENYLGSGGPITSETFVALNHYVKGDFDIRSNHTAPIVASVSYSYCRLYIMINSLKYMHITYINPTSVTQSRRVAYSTTGISNETRITVSSLPHAWWRITRVGSLWSAYYSSDGNIWSLGAGNINLGSEDISVIRLQAGRIDNRTARYLWSNFTIQSADEVVSKAEYVPVRPTSPHISYALNTSVTHTYRIRFIAEQIGNTNGTIGKSKFQFRGMPSGTSMIIDSAYVGKASSSGSLWNFDSTPIQIKFNDGENSIQIPNTETITSDEVSYNANGSEDIVISFTVTYINASSIYYSKGEYDLIRTGGGSWYMTGSYAGDVTIPSMSDFKPSSNWGIPVLTSILSSTL